MTLPQSLLLHKNCHQCLEKADFHPQKKNFLEKMMKGTGCTGNLNVATILIKTNSELFKKFDI